MNRAQQGLEVWERVSILLEGGTLCGQLELRHQVISLAFI